MLIYYKQTLGCTKNLVTLVLVIEKSLRVAAALWC